MVESEEGNGRTSPPIRRSSFIVRCWQRSAEQVRAHLVDVRTGRVYPLLDLAELPARIRALLGLPPPPDAT